MSRQIREATVAVGLFRNAKGGFLIRYNPKWRGYSLPMTKVRTTDFSKQAAAIRAVEDALGRHLQSPQAEPLTYSWLVGDHSQSHDDRPAKVFYVYEVDRTGQAWKWIRGDQLRDADDLSPTVEPLRIAVIAAAESC